MNASAVQLKALYKNAAEKTLSEIVESFLNKRGVSCFTEKNDNLLMWSHYADGGRGICLEFEASDALFEKAKKVNYVESIPLLSLDRMLCDKSYDDVMELFRTKSKAWEYEQEWRVMHESAGTSWCYDSTALTGIYFGPSTPDDLIDVICLILGGQNEHVQFYRGSRNSEHFRVDFTKFNYTSHLNAIKLGLKG
ncbi:conserved hypothetical protein [uncultured Stenotrophomonas sp.]|uniref:DUF2971 domain-containing protein n=1 Tax=uncultured Stenotrophomonas sp. TaxID=165438 RepID=A0A1Y5Q6Y7_9GAMM|nr:conserved hypothetical protein [uncultured Stenotrophomonas sp.]